MRHLAGVGIAALLALALPGAPASAATVPFSEGFSTSDSQWRGNGNTVGSLDWSPDGYVTEVFNFQSSVAGGQGPVLFRGTASAGSSGGNFVGDWILDGVSEIRALVRHDAPTDVVFFARFAANFGFPGAIITLPTAVSSSSSFTELVFDISPDSPFIFYEEEATGFEGVFGENVRFVQFGVSVPESLAGVDANYDFDLDGVSTVPEAGGLCALALAASAALGALRARKRSF